MSLEDYRAGGDKESALARAFDFQVRALAPDLPRALREFEFDPNRRWRLDRAWPDYKVAVELEGGTHSRPIRCHNCGTEVRAVRKSGEVGRRISVGGFHQTSRYLTDREKYNALALGGWTLLRFVHDDVVDNPGAMVETIRMALESHAFGIRPPDVSISPFEERVLYLVAAGIRSREIGSRLGVTTNSIRQHADRLQTKLMAPNRAASVARALAWGLIQPSQIPWAWEEYVMHIQEGAQEEDDSEGESD
jgi:DNA-binding CsgD family transcriptional regulator